MENILNFENVSYEAEPPIKQLTAWEYIAFYGGIFLDCVRLLIFIIPNFCVAIFRLFVYPPQKSVAGQTALVTGAGNGIGREIALRLAREGCNVAIADVDKKAASKTASDIRKLGVQSKDYYVDVTEHKQLNQLKKDIEKDLGFVDILVNNAGIVPLLSIREGTEQEIERIVKVNITSHFYTVRTFLPGMLTRRRGHIVGIASMMSLHPIPGSVIYSSTKFAVQGFVQALYQEIRQEGYGDVVHCTSVHPGLVSTRKGFLEAFNFRVLPITAERTANETVNAMLRNKQQVSIPSWNIYLTMILGLLSFRNQDLIRDYVLMEKVAYNVKLKKIAA